MVFGKIYVTDTFRAISVKRLFFGGGHVTVPSEPLLLRCVGSRSSRVGRVRRGRISVAAPQTTDISPLEDAPQGVSSNLCSQKIWHRSKETYCPRLDFSQARWQGMGDVLQYAKVWL